jgi:hypothetical protein
MAADIDYDFRPESYWPADQRPAEDERVTLASIVLESTLGDVAWVTATPASNGGIALDVSDDNAMEPVFAPGASTGRCRCGS